MAGTGDRFYVRRDTGEPVGPFSAAVIATMLARGQLDGSEQISPDRKTWSSVQTLTNEGPPPAPATDQPAWGERDLGELGDLSLAPPGSLDQVGPAPTPATAAPSSSVNLLDGDGIDLAPLELDRSGFEGPPGANSGASDLAPAPAPESAAPEGSRRGPPSPRPAHPASATNPALDASVPLDVGEDHPGSIPLTDLGLAPPTTSSQPPAPNGSAPLSDLIGGGGGGGAAAVTVRQGRTMSAAKARPERPPPVSRKKVLFAATGVVLVGAIVAAFLVFDLADRIAGEPEVADLLGEAAADIARDRYPAYERGAQRLLDAATSQRRSGRLRAAAAELLASSVILRRGERTRLGKADGILNDLASGPSGAVPSGEMTRARAWVALGKGRPRDAARLLEEAPAAATGPEGKLLSAWIEMGQRKYAAAERSFRQGATEHPGHTALLYGLGRAQEDGGKPEAAATYAQVLAASATHGGAALGIARGEAVPARGLVLAQKLLSQAGDVSRSELADAHAVAARALRALGKPAEATAAVGLALTKDAGNPTALVAAGELLLDEGRVRDAIAKFKLALPGAPTLPIAVPARDLRYAAAALLIEEGRAPEGLGLLPAAPAAGDKTTGDPRGMFWRARAAELQAPPDVEGARRGYEAALKLDARFVPASLQLATLLIREKRAPEALAVLRRAESAGAPPGALQIALGQALLTSGDVERAKKTFRELLSKTPRNAAARMGLADALDASGNVTGARAELELLLAQSPETADLRPRLAEILVRLGDRDRALSLYQAEVAAGQASFATRLAAAKLALELGRLPVALSLAETLVADAPQTPGALLLLGRVRRAGGDIAGALTEQRRALAFESTPELHFEYGKTLAMGGKQEQALAELEMAGALPAANIERGRLLAERGDFGRAIPLLESALKAAPGSGDAWLLLGNAHDRLGAHAQAAAAWRSALKAGATNPELFYRLGRREMDQGRPGPAALLLRQAAAKVGPAEKTGKPPPWTADLYFQLGFAEKARGNRSGEVAALKKYLTTAAADAPSRKEVEEELRRLGSLP